MKHTPTVRKTDNYRYLLLDVLHGEYRNATIQSWQLAGLVLGLQEFGGNNISTLFEKWKKTILTGGGEWKIPVQKVDFALLAYALLKTTDNPQEIKKAMQEMMSVLKKINVRMV